MELSAETGELYIAFRSPERRTARRSGSIPSQESWLLATSKGSAPAYGVFCRRGSSTKRSVPPAMSNRRYSGLDPFLSDMALEPPNTTADNSLFQQGGDTDRLVLSTVHSAKGLEWDTVFVIFALDGRFPSMHAMQNEADLEEELRLMYVAATRARESLTFVYPMVGYDRATGMILGQPSRFLGGLSEDLLLREYTE